MQRTTIEWVAQQGVRGYSSNPIKAQRRDTGKVGWVCVTHDPSCASCYAEARNRWVGTGLAFNRPARDQVAIVLDDRELQALTRVRDAKIFVGDMIDLFSAFVPDAHLDALFTTLEANPHAMFLLLTKRVERMHAYLTRRWGSRALSPRHIWCGCSAGRQREYDRHRPFLEPLPAAVRFWSLEPLIGPIDLGLTATARPDWVLCGGESRRNPRPPHPDWFRALRDACQAAAAPFHFKQWGTWAHLPGAGLDVATLTRRVRQYAFPDGVVMHRLGKGAAGRMLDGRVWDETPTAEDTRCTR
jgi:protein gp37